MRYAFHFEFCERPELPEWLRSDVFRSLSFIEDRFGLRSVLSRDVPRLIRRIAPQRVIELGSGSGAGLALIAAASLPGSSGEVLDHLATDKFPQPELWREKLKGIPGARWSETPVGFDDFDQVLGADELKGSVLLLVSAFHHLSPDQARDFLKRAARAGAHVLVVEPLSRTLGGLAMGLGAGLAGLLYPILGLLSGRCGSNWLRQAFFHWLVPVVPFILSHDGAVSALRQRTLGEWRDLSGGTSFDLKTSSNLGFLSNFSAMVLANRMAPCPRS